MSKLFRNMFLCWLFLNFQLLVSQEFQKTASDEHKYCVKSDVKILDKYKKYIENSTWVVPPNTLLAYTYANGNMIPVSDQTVWVIDKFDGGYFFGNTYVSIDGAPSNQMKLVGSITPFGDVYITFYPVDGNLTNTDVVNGIGKFKKFKGRYYFVMQMNSAQNNLFGLSHWSYMLSVTEKDFFYRHLPGQNMSVPEFIAQF